MERGGGNIVAVPLFFRKAPRTRAEIVAAADRSRARGRLKRAAAGYREVLATDPDDSSVNLKLAPVLARLGDPDESARCFRRAAEKHLAAGFTDCAAAVCATASAILPLDAGFRLEIARLNLLRGRKADAVGALVDGARALARARRRPAAAALLRRAIEIVPDHLEAGLALAPVLAAEGSPDEARAILAALERTVRGRALRRVRWVAFRLRPSPAHCGASWPQRSRADARPRRGHPTRPAARTRRAHFLRGNASVDQAPRGIALRPAPCSTAAECRELAHPQPGAISSSGSCLGSPPRWARSRSRSRSSTGWCTAAWSCPRWRPAIRHPGMWGALFVPELVVLFISGWRLRSWTLVALHAGLATAVRELSQADSSSSSASRDTRARARCRSSRSRRRS